MLNININRLGKHLFNVFAKDKNSNTPLNFAAYFDHQDVNSKDTSV